MGSLSVSTHRGLVHWQGLLLLVSLLTFWSPPSTAKVSVVSTYAAEGRHVILRVRNMPSKADGVVWYKGDGLDNTVVAYSVKTPTFLVTGPEDYEKVIAFNDGSLVLKYVTKEDEGLYTVVVSFPDSRVEIGSGMLHVCEYLRVPILLFSSYWVTENEDDVVLTCFTNGLNIQWLLNGTSLQLTNRIKPSWNRRRLTINPVKREDAGVYKCIATNPAMRVESQPTELRVIYK